MGKHMTATLPTFSLKPKFIGQDNMQRPVAVFNNKPEFTNFKHMLTKHGAKFESQSRKKTKNRSASWMITLTSPLSELP
jgi:hypothetical protein